MGKDGESGLHKGAAPEVKLPVDLEHELKAPEHLSEKVIKWVSEGVKPAPHTPPRRRGELADRPSQLPRARGCTGGCRIARRAGCQGDGKK